MIKAVMRVWIESSYQNSGVVKRVNEQNSLGLYDLQVNN